MNYTKSQWWERFQKYYTEFPSLDLAVDFPSKTLAGTALTLGISRLGLAWSPLPLRYNFQNLPPVYDAARLTYSDVPSEIARFAAELLRQQLP